METASSVKRKRYFFVGLPIVIAGVIMYARWTDRIGIPANTVNVIIPTTTAPIKEQPMKQNTPAPKPPAPPAPTVPWGYENGNPLPSNLSLNESDSPSTSGSPDLWLDSGGLFTISNGIGSTIEGSLSPYSLWRVNYSFSNPVDTDMGYHPQNIFRLVTKKVWSNESTEAYFLVTNNNFSQSMNRNESNGLLLMNRYADSNNLYYAGIRVDGFAIIKKKYQGSYTTLNEQKILPGEYDQFKSPSLLPKGRWIGIKTEITTDSAGTHIVLYTDLNNSKQWNKVLEATDDGTNGNQIYSGASGIRTDFMDVKIKEFKVKEVNKP